MNLNREILRLSIPAIASNVTVPLLGLSDTAISGHLGSESYLGAIAVGSMMLNVLFWLFGFLRMGTTGLTAAAFGRRCDDEMREVFCRSVALALGIGFLLIVFQDPLLRGMLFLVAPDDEVTGLASRYFSLCIYESPALLGIMAISGWFVGMQSTLWAMIIAISVNVINIATSFLLVFPLEIGFTGVAIGTLVANWIGFFIAIWTALRMAPGGRLWCGWRCLWNKVMLSKFFTVNGDLFLRSACIMAVTLAVTGAGARLGALTLAANAVMMQFFHFFSFFMDGFAFTGEALCGRFYGALNPGMMRKAVRYLLFWAAGVAILFFLLYLMGWNGIVAMLTDAPAVRQAVAEWHIWILLIPPVTVLAFIFDGFYIGVSCTRPMLVVTLLASASFFIIAFMRFGEVVRIESPQNSVLWMAFLSYLFVRGGLLGVIWPHKMRSIFRK